MVVVLVGVVVVLVVVVVADNKGAEQEVPVIWLLIQANPADTRE